MNILVAGIVVGCTYSLAGASLAIAYRSTRTLNFALGGAGGFCAYVALSGIDRGVPWIASLLLAMLAGALIGAGLEFIGRRLRRASQLTAAMGLFGGLLLTQGVTGWVWGDTTRVLRGPFSRSSELHLGGVVITDNALLSVIVTVAVVSVLLLYLYCTPSGLRMRAASGGPITAQTVGVRLNMTTTIGWAIGGAIGAVAAVFVNMTGTMLPTTFSGFIFLALVALTLGGLTSITGVLAGGLVFGIVLYVAESELSTRLTYVFAYVFLAVLLFYRPSGLLGRPERRIVEPELVPRRSEVGLLRQLSRRSKRIVEVARVARFGMEPQGETPRGSMAVRTVVGALMVVATIFWLFRDGPLTVSLSMTQVLSMFVAVMGLDILMGYCGQVSLAQASFLGIGAYVAALTIAHLDVPWFLVFPFGIVGAAMVGILVGIPAIRLQGLYFAQLTLLFALALPEVILYFSSVTNGVDGLFVTVPQFSSLTRFEQFVLYGAIAGVAAAGVGVLRKSSVGRHWRAVRDNAESAAGLGQHVTLTKLGAFAVGCGLAGLGGVMQVLTVGSVSSASYPVWESIYLQAAQVIGGMTSMLGNLLGAFFVTLVPTYVGGTSIPSDFIFGVAFLAVLMLNPGGLSSIASSIWDGLWELPGRVRVRTSVSGTRRMIDGSSSKRRGSGRPFEPVTPGMSPKLPCPRLDASAGKPVSAEFEVAGVSGTLTSVPSTIECGTVHGAGSSVGPKTPSLGENPSRDTVLEVRGLRAGYRGSEVLHGVDLHVRRGEVVAVVGPNGAGKSTLLRAVTGLVAASEGSVTYAGHDVTGTSPYALARSGVAHVVEGRGVFPDLSVEENLRLGSYCATHEHDGALTYNRQEVLEIFPNLSSRMHQLGGTLSGGEQQMLAIARALLMAPRLLILDEPLLGLSPQVTENVLNSLSVIAQRHPAILIVEQNVRQVLEICDRAAVLADGRIVEEGSPGRLASDSDLAEKYFGLAEKAGAS